MANKSNLTQDFKDLLKLLKHHHVRYLLIGGYAVALYGHVRYTKDIDIWIAIDQENVEKVRAALLEFGYAEANQLEFVYGKMTRMGMPPFRIELLTEISGVTFEQCYPRRRVMLIDDLEIDVIDITDLRTNKAASGRLQDLADLEKLPKPSDLEEK
jgi:hypothetical protein